MVNYLHAQRKALQEKLLEEIGDFDYRCTRYKVNYSIALACTKEPIDLTPLCIYIRKSDRYIPLGENIHAVVFDCTDSEKGIKAANKLLTYFQHTYFSKSAFSSIITASDCGNPVQTVSQLFDLLDYALRHNMDNHVIDKSQVMKRI